MFWGKIHKLSEDKLENCFLEEMLVLTGVQEPTLYNH